MDTSPEAGRTPTWVYRLVRNLFRWSLRIFFRRIEVEGIENIPQRGGGIIIAWHPNGVIDGALVAAECPRPVIFGARHGLLRFPLLGWVLRSIGTVPIYRACDLPRRRRETRQEANTRSLERLAQAVARGSLTALFPEGLSHDSPHPVAVRTGAARLHDMARELRTDGATPFVLPVGLHYDAKDLVRSSVLVRFHPPLTLPAELTTSAPEESEDARYARLRALTDLFERTLHEVVLATEDWRSHRLMHRARKLIRAELAHRRGTDPGPATLREKRAGSARIWAAAQVLAREDPTCAADLMQRVANYDDDLRAIGLEDHHLDRDQTSRSASARWVLQARAGAVFLLLAPVALVGFVANGLTALLIGRLAQIVGHEVKDRASVKVLVGIIAFPVTWGAVGLLAAYGATRLAGSSLSSGFSLGVGLAAALLSAVGLPASLLFSRKAVETAHAIRVRAGRRRHGRTMDRLRRERSALFDALLKASEGMELPGRVLSDGSIESEPPAPPIQDTET